MRNPLPLASALVIVTLALCFAPTVQAQSCPADLTWLDAQVSTPRLKTALEKPFDDLVSQAGSLPAAISQAQAQLADLQARRAALPVDASEAEKTLYNDAILIGQNRVSGLQCRLPT